MIQQCEPGYFLFQPVYQWQVTREVPGKTGELLIDIGRVEVQQVGCGDQVKQEDMSLLA